MSRTVYFSTRQQHGGCGCLALGLILGLLFLKSFWRPLLLFFLLVTVVGWIRAFFVPKKTTTFQKEQTYFEDSANPYGYPYQSRKRKEADVIEED
ncbi:glucan phosphoethanolaminetransferase (alkaline phosphatase superfamily) [Streptococcus rupicaprae]|uniref:Glucan phosphoethanolaminetransferase (Alkaline phosphatase superfamily) n=1 Tax=Streptococcus rupicaprae TaxID=759619 RepID=A0ABV2FET5_9STRE